MLTIKIENKNYDIPTEWKDMKLSFWYGIYNIINKYADKDEDGQLKVDQSDNAVNNLKLNRDLFIYLTGISKKKMESLDLDSVTAAISTFYKTLKKYEPKGITEFELDGATYKFPSEFLKRNTFGDYIESTHLETTIKMMKHGRYDVLPEQMAILCRQDGEVYSDEAIPDKTEKFKNLTMDIVWEFAFFLTLQSVNLAKIFRTFLGKDKAGLQAAKEEFLQESITTSS